MMLIFLLLIQILFSLFFVLWNFWNISTFLFFCHVSNFSWSAFYFRIMMNIYVSIRFIFISSRSIFIPFDFLLFLSFILRRMHSKKISLSFIFLFYIMNWKLWNYLQFLIIHSICKTIILFLVRVWLLQF